MPGYYVVVAGREVIIRASGDGLVQDLAFGRIDNGVFTLLPALPPGDQPAAATW
jgi:hypothetical protein